MADQKVRITELPLAQAFTSGAKMIVNQGGIDYQISVDLLMQADNNLSEVDPVQARSNLSIYSKSEVDKLVGNGDLSALGEADGFKYVGMVESFSALANVIPEKAGQVIILKSHQPGKSIGGGFFEAVTGKIPNGFGASDGGVRIQTNDSFYWRRMISDPGELDVTHFGALPDAQTDSAPAALLMHKYFFQMQDDTNGGVKADPTANIDIQFPAGRFLFTNMDLSGQYISRFRFSGKHSKDYGYFASTQIILAGESDKPAVKVTARQTLIEDIHIYGQYDKAANTRGFFENTQQSGEYFHASNFYVNQTGGTIFKVWDTLDTQFKDFYTANTYGQVIYGMWSANASGSWYHTTAIRIINANLQGGKSAKPSIELPKCTQALMENVWIEKTNNPLDLSNGYWVINTLSLEGCTLPANFTYCRLVMTALNLQSGSTVTYNDPNTKKDQGTYELGRVYMENYGLDVTGSVAFDYMHSNLRIKNTTAAPVWYRMGQYKTLDKGDVVRMRFVGANPDDESAITTGASNNFGGGEAILTMRRPVVSGQKAVGSVEVSGTSPILDVKIFRPYENDNDIYVQLPANSGWVNFNMETTTHSRFTAGSCFVWSPDGSVATKEDMDKLNFYSPRKTFRHGTIGAAIGAREDGIMMWQGKALAEKKLPISINGTDYFINLESAPWGSDGFMRQGDILGTPNDNYYGGSYLQNWDGVNVAASTAVTNNGSLKITTKAAASVAFPVKQTNYEVSFRLVSGPANPGTDVQTTFDFRRPTSNTGVDAYRVAFMSKTEQGVNTLRLYRRVGGQSVVIGDSDKTMTDGQTLRVWVSEVVPGGAQGNHIKVFADDVLLWDLVDPTTTLGGRVLGFGTGSNNAGIEIDHFKVYTL